MKVSRRYASLTGVTYEFNKSEIIAALAEKFDIPLDESVQTSLTVDDDPMTSVVLDVRYEVEVPRASQETTGDKG